MEIDWSRNNRVIFMHCVLVDTCGWVAVIEAGINIDHALLECVGTKQLAILPKIVSELESLNDRKLMIKMLLSKAIMLAVDMDQTNWLFARSREERDLSASSIHRAVFGVTVVEVTL